MQSRKSKIYTLTRCSLLSALLCITSPFIIPFGVVPFTLAIMMVMLISNILSVKESLIAVLVYIFLGIVGIPVFSGFQGGVNIIAGPTGGVILSYVPVSIVVSSMRNKKFCMRILPGIFALLICYIMGTIHFVLVSGEKSIVSAVSVCVVPFLVPDVAKVVAATYFGGKIRIKLSEQYIL